MADKQRRHSLIYPLFTHHILYGKCEVDYFMGRMFKFLTDLLVDFQLKIIELVLCYIIIIMYHIIIY